MVALLHPQADAHTGTRSMSAPSGLRLVVDNTSKPAGASGQISGELPSIDRSLVLTIAIAAVVVFGALFSLRAVQGTPAVDAVTVDQVGSASASVAVSSPGDQVVVAKAGDSMWSIAVSLRPNTDPRPTVETLIEANGGDSVRIGQQIVIPEQLLD